jgi:hypothetical protein
MLPTIARFKPNVTTLTPFTCQSISQIGQRYNQRPIPQALIDLAAELAHTGAVAKTTNFFNHSSLRTWSKCLFSVEAE